MPNFHTAFKQRFYRRKKVLYHLNGRFLMLCSHLKFSFFSFVKCCVVFSNRNGLFYLYHNVNFIHLTYINHSDTLIIVPPQSSFIKELLKVIQSLNLPLGNRF